MGAAANPAEAAISPFCKSNKLGAALSFAHNANLGFANNN
jgi:hypothetical protein